jgi:acyl-CoA-dependent ceramide synthase
MTFGLKVYYLLQASYWVQQFILLAARVEKPRKDFKELVVHVSIYTEGKEGFD